MCGHYHGRYRGHHDYRRYYGSDHRHHHHGCCISHFVSFRSWSLFLYRCLTLSARRRGSSVSIGRCSFEWNVAEIEKFRMTFFFNSKLPAECRCLHLSIRCFKVFNPAITSGSFSSTPIVAMVWYHTPPQYFV